MTNSQQHTVTCNVVVVRQQPINSTRRTSQLERHIHRQITRNGEATKTEVGPSGEDTGEFGGLTSKATRWICMKPGHQAGLLLNYCLLQLIAVKMHQNLQI